MINVRALLTIAWVVGMILSANSGMVSNDFVELAKIENDTQSIYSSSVLVAY